ncbi:MAG: peptidylprolyl isomerase [Rhodospirillales bacterium]
MKRLLTRLAAPLFLALAAFVAVPGPSSEAVAADAPDANTLYLYLKDNNRVTIQMRPDLAPRHVARIKELVRQKFYDGLAWHRVIAGFMAQGGDPRGDGTGGSGINLPAEFSREPFRRGTVGMARSSDPNSGDSQFFIVYGRTEHLDEQYTVWGEVTEGMVHVGRIKRGDPDNGGRVFGPDHIVKMRMALDPQD